MLFPVGVAEEKDLEAHLEANVKTSSAVESVSNTLTAILEQFQVIAQSQERQALAAERHAAALEGILLKMNNSGTM